MSINEPEIVDELFQLLSQPFDFATIKSDYSTVFERLKNCNREDALVKIGSLLCDATLQSNCLRLETLAHIALVVCKGNSLISDEDVSRCFSELGEGICGAHEDPAEDVFVSLVHTPHGNFRVLEGIWESSTFYLQRILDVIETLPDKPAFKMLQDRVYALLALSEAVCRRIELKEYQDGQPFPLDTLSPEHCQFMKCGCVAFSQEELEKIGINSDRLDLFILTHESLETIEKQQILDSMFQRYPVWVNEGKVVLALPGAVSFAIRMAICNQLIPHYRQSLVNQLEVVFHELWDRSGMLGLHGRPRISFRASHGGTPHLEFLSIDDSGANVHFYFLLEDFVDMPSSGLNTPKMLSKEDNVRIKKSIAAARDHSKKQNVFIRGMTLVVFCGIGRVVGLERSCMTELDDWNVEFLSAADFDVLNHQYDFSAVDLFRFFDWRKKVESMGLQLHNNNGLLNLLAFQHSDEGAVVNSNALDPRVREHGGGLMIGCNFLSATRQEYWRTTDYRRILSPTGEFCLARRDGGNRNFNLVEVAVYAIPEVRDTNGIPIAITLSNSDRVWWGRSIADEGHVISYNEFEMLRVWFRRCVPILERELGGKLPQVVELVTHNCRFSNQMELNVVIPSDKSEIEQSIEIETHQRFRCCIKIGETFWLGQRFPANVAERAFVRSICKAFYELADIGLDSKKLELLEQEIVPNDDARQVHFITANSYRDRAQNDKLSKTIYFDESDIRLLKLGMAFLVEPRFGGRKTVENKEECLSLLKTLLRNLENELCQELRKFNKGALLSLALRNHETACIERTHWLRTGRANRAINSDQPDKLEQIIDKDLQANIAILPCRLLIEFGIASCMTSGGRIPGKLELSQLMAKACSIFQYGGWFNAIWWEWMPPKLLITPLGDIHAKVDYEFEVLKPYAQMHSQDRVEAKSNDYEENYRVREPVPMEEIGIDLEFEKAFENEFGFTINEMRTFVDCVEDFGQETGNLVFTTTLSGLVEKLDPHVSEMQCVKIVSELQLRSREGYRNLSDGLTDEDLDPWRFGRKMSLNRKPLVAMNSTANPLILLAPGLIRESFAYTLRQYYDAEVRHEYCRSLEMRTWHGAKNSLRGSEFGSLLACRLEEIGWKVLAKEQEITSLLGIGQDEKFGKLNVFGDVDILAYNENSKRLLAIECKHLHYKKTPGEIAEQLNDYRGELRQDGKKLKKDELKKHLDRLEILQHHRQKLLKRQSLPQDTSLEGWVVFRWPVPMLLCWDKFKQHTKIGVYKTIENDLTEQ